MDHGPVLASGKLYRARVGQVGGVGCVDRRLPDRLDRAAGGDPQHRPGGARAGGHEHDRPRQRRRAARAPSGSRAGRRRPARQTPGRGRRGAARRGRAAPRAARRRAARTAGRRAARAARRTPPRAGCSGRGAPPAAGTSYRFHQPEASDTAYRAWSSRQRGASTDSLGAAHDERRVRHGHGAAGDGADPQLGAVPRHAGWSQLIHASFVPSGDGGGEREELRAGDQDPDGGGVRRGGPVERHRHDRAAHLHAAARVEPGLGLAVVREARLPHAPDLPAVGGEDQVGEAEPGTVRGQRRGRAAGRRPTGTAAGRRSSRRRDRSRPPATAPAGTTGRRTRAPGCARTTGPAAAPAAPYRRPADAMIVDAAALGGAALLPPHLVRRRRRGTRRPPPPWPRPRR